MVSLLCQGEVFFDVTFEAGNSSDGTSDMKCIVVFREGAYASRILAELCEVEHKLVIRHLKEDLLTSYGRGPGSSPAGHYNGVSDFDARGFPISWIFHNLCIKGISAIPSMQKNRGQCNIEYAKTVV